LVYRSAKGKAYTLDYREMAPLFSSRDMYLDSTGQVIPGKSFVGIHSVGIPGAVAGMEAMHKRLGKLAWEELVQPAVDLARNGVVLTGKEARGLNRNRADFMKYNPGRAYMVKADSTQWAEGELFIQSDLANTLERILKFKSKGFYQGETADLIVEEMKRQGGIITHRDLKSYKAVWRKPLFSQFKQYSIIGMPPPSSGGVAISQLFSMIKPYPLARWGAQSDSTIQVIIEAERRVYADRAKWLGDPDFVKVPIKELLDTNYLSQRMQNVSFDKATKSSDISAGTFSGYESPETTHYSIVDKDGNAVAITTTLNNSYGSKVL